MRLGIISDIHGDYDALMTVLDRLDHYHKVDQVLCAGDLVGRGPNPSAVVRAIRAHNIPTVRGNHDDWNNDLAPEDVDYIRDLPLDWQGVFEGLTVFMCHGKPGNNIWGLYRDHISKTLLNMMLKTLEADVLITGHTHVPMCVQVSRGVVINPGSLYTFDNLRSSSHTYGVLHLPDVTFDLYDVTGSPEKPLPCAF
jgi:putative phosphoesterase